MKTDSKVALEAFFITHSRWSARRLREALECAFGSPHHALEYLREHGREAYEQMKKMGEHQRDLEYLTKERKG